MKLLCITDYRMEDDNELAFAVGRLYDFIYMDNEFYHCIDELGCPHQMHVTDLIESFTIKA